MSDLPRIPTPRGDVSIQGAHLLQWRTAHGGDGLFLSPRASFVAGTPIRGGIPLVFPWFGDDPEGKGRPAHGFARRVPWRVDADRSDAAQGRVVMTLADDDATRSWWPHAFTTELRIDLGDALAVEWTVHNRDRAPFRFEALFHTYLGVGDVRRCAVRGLQGASYHDKLDGNRRKTDADAVLTFAGECDRTYVGTAADCVLEDPVLRRTLRVRKSGAPSTVVWNPWRERSARFADLDPEDWQRFLCIESGCVMDDAVTLAPGQSHRLTLTIERTA